MKLLRHLTLLMIVLGITNVTHARSMPPIDRAQSYMAELHLQENFKKEFFVRMVLHGTASGHAYEMLQRTNGINDSRGFEIQRVQWRGLPGAAKNEHSKIILIAKNHESEAPHDQKDINVESNSPELNDAIRLYENGKLRSAIKLIKTLLEKDNENAIAYYYLGLAYSKKKKRNRALKAFRRSVSLDPSLGQAHCQMGKLLESSRKDYDEAIGAYRECLRFDQNSGPSYFGLGKLYYYKKEYERSQDAFKAAFENRRTLDSEARYTVGMSLALSLLQVLNEPDRWVGKLDYAHDQVVAQKYRTYGSFKSRENLDVFRMSLMPEGYRVLRSMMEEAFVYLNDTQTTKPQDPKPLVIMGCAYFNHFLLTSDIRLLNTAKKKLMQAAAVAEESGDTVGDEYAKAEYLLGLIELSEEKFQEALNYLKRAQDGYIPPIWFISAIGPDWKSLIEYYLGVCYEELGDSDEAIRYYRMAIEKHMNHMSPYIRIGQIHYRKDELDRAIAIWMEPGMTMEEWKQHGHPEEEYKLFPSYLRQSYNIYETGYLYHLLAQAHYDRCRKGGECSLQTAIEYAKESIYIMGHKEPQFQRLLKELEEGQAIVK